MREPETQWATLVTVPNAVMVDEVSVGITRGGGEPDQDFAGFGWLLRWRRSCRIGGVRVLLMLLTVWQSRCRELLRVALVGLGKFTADAGQHRAALGHVISFSTASRRSAAAA